MPTTYLVGFDTDRLRAQMLATHDRANFYSSAMEKLS
jgi:hypothetical protein